MCSCSFLAVPLKREQTDQVSYLKANNLTPLHLLLLLMVMDNQDWLYNTKQTARVSGFQINRGTIKQQKSTCYLLIKTMGKDILCLQDLI